MSNHYPYCFLCKVTEAIISGLSGTDVIFGGDLHTVVSLFDPIIQKYNTANYESFVLATNMYQISNILVNSSEAWGDLTNVGERYLLSTVILTNIDNVGFLFLSENPSTKGKKTFKFSHIEVILDAQKAPTELGFPNCYQFNQVVVKTDFKIYIDKIIFPQGSICIPNAVYDKTNETVPGVASAVEFYNRENLLLPPFQYDPQTNLSTVISFSMDNGSKVQLADDVDPIRITFNEVRLFLLFL